jgi:putative transposase
MWRHLCRLLNIIRTFKRYKSVKPQQDEIIMKRLRKLATRWKRFKRLHILLHREGFTINHKRTYSIYKEAGLYEKERKNVPQKNEEARDCNHLIPDDPLILFLMLSLIAVV